MGDQGMHDTVPVYPWLASAYRDLAARMDQLRFPHGILLNAAQGGGKSAFAHALANRLLCQSPSAHSPCGECRSCQLIASRTHPDLLWLEPEAAERPVIKVDQVRAVTDELVLASHSGGRRVAVIDPADCLNTQAANSLLKTLEEPPSGVVLVLVAARLARLPATIRSRCQVVTLPLPSRENAEQWLRARHRSDAIDLLGMAQGAPLQAVSLADANMATIGSDLANDLLALVNRKQHATALAGRWQATGAARVITLARHYLADIMRAKAGGPEAVRLTASEPLARLVASVDWRVLYHCSDELTSLHRALEQPLNETLALERLFLAWQGLGAREMTWVG